MNEFKTSVPPLPESMPAWLREWLADEKVWLVMGGMAALVAVLVLFSLSRRLWRALFGRRIVDLPSDAELFEDLASCPLAVQSPGDRCLTVYHLPVRLRLVVVAPVGRTARWIPPK